jgi:hypothetical protein
LADLIYGAVAVITAALPVLVTATLGDRLTVPGWIGASA